jgi:TP901 family phage tail tape measure protein
MASRKEYELLFALNAQLGGSYNSTFKSAQNSLIQMQKEIDALGKLQSNITAYEKQQGAIEATRKKLEVLRQQYENVQKEISETGTYSSDLENKLLQKQQQIDKTNISIDAQTDKLNRMGNALHVAGINTEALGTEESKLGSQMDVLKQKQEAAAEKANSFGSSASIAFDAVGQAIVSAGIVRTLEEIYNKFMACADASVEFESGLTGVEKTTDMNDRQLAALGEDIKELSTDIPVTTSELNEIAEAAGQLGIQQDSLLDFTEVMANLGVATNLSSMDASTALAKFANVVRMSADDYGRLGSVIVDLGNKGASTESEIVEMATRLASAGSLIGLSEPDIMAVASALSSLGIEAEAGGSAISKLMKEFEVMVQTGAPALEKFAKVAGMSADDFSIAWGKNPVEALGAFIDGLGRIDATGGSAVATLEGLGVTEIRMSNAVLSLASSGGILNDSLAVANKAWKENTALTIEAEKRYATTESQFKMMQDGYNNLKIAIGDNYTPTLKELYEAGNQVLGGMTEFVQQHPTLVKAVTAFVGVLGIAIAGLAAYAAAAKIATLFTAAFTTAAGVSLLGPILLVVAGVAALTAGIVALSGAMKGQLDETWELTAASRDQYKELQELNDEYKNAKEVYGETSYEAQQLKWQIDDLTKEYEGSKQTLEEYTTAHENLMKNYQEMSGSHEESAAKIDTEQKSVLALIQKLDELISTTDGATKNQQAILAIIDALNKSVPELALSFDDVANASDGFIDSLYDIAKAQAAQLALEDKWGEYIDRVGQQDALKQAKEAAEANAKIAQEEYTVAKKAWEDKVDLYKYSSGFDGGWGMIIGTKEEGAAMDAAKKQMDEYNTALAETSKAYNENAADIEDLEGAFKDFQAAQDEAAVSGENISVVIKDITDKVADLAVKYNEAYTAALDSIEGQYSLWDKAAKVVATNAGAMNDALESQISYWKKYNDNLAGLTDRSADIEGLSEMLSSFADGSKESVNAVAGMAKASDSDLKEMVKNWQTLRTEQETVADKLANLETDFKDTMDTLQKELETTVGKMRLDDKAAQSGKSTIQGFIDGAENMIPEVQAAYKKIADAAIAAIDAQLQIHSPSKVLWEKGKYSMSGFIGGVEAMEPDVAEAMRSAANTGADAFTANAINAEGGGSGVSISLDYSPQYDLGDGNSTSDIEAILRTHDNNLRDILLDLLESVGIDAKRRAYV